MELLLETADGVDLGDPAEIAQLRTHHPVLEFAQVRRRPLLAVGTPCPWLGLDGVHEDLAEARRDRPHRGLDSGRQLRAHLLDALVDELPREIDIDTILEDDRHLREPVTGDRAGATQPGQACHGGLHRERDALLGLERRVARGLGIDLHLDIGDVRYGVDRQAAIVVESDHRHHERGQKHEPPVADRALQQPLKPRRGFSGHGQRRIYRCRP